MWSLELSCTGGLHDEQICKVCCCFVSHMCAMHQALHLRKTKRAADQGTLISMLSLTAKLVQLPAFKDQDICYLSDEFISAD